MNNKPRLLLIIGDIVIFMFFAFTGRETHAPGDANLIVNVLPTLLTFLIVCFAIALAGGVYRSDAITHPRSVIRRTLIAWIIAAPIAILIRAIILSRPAIPWQFVAVTLGFGRHAAGAVAWWLCVVSHASFSLS